jgi:fructose 1,6-bisphosphatase
LDDKIAHLRSRERLALVAGKLGMHDPAAYAVVRLPQLPVVAERERGLAFLSAITGWIR